MFIQMKRSLKDTLETYVTWILFFRAPVLDSAQNTNNNTKVLPDYYGYYSFVIKYALLWFLHGSPRYFQEYHGMVHGQIYLQSVMLSLYFDSIGLPWNALQKKEQKK